MLAALGCGSSSSSSSSGGSGASGTQITGFGAFAAKYYESGVGSAGDACHTQYIEAVLSNSCTGPGDVSLTLKLENEAGVMPAAGTYGVSSVAFGQCDGGVYAVAALELPDAGLLQAVSGQIVARSVDTTNDVGRSAGTFDVFFADDGGEELTGSFDGTSTNCP